MIGLPVLARRILTSLAVWLAIPTLAQAQTVHTGHLDVRLVSQVSAATPGATIYVAIHQKIEKGWHTYWRNPGDAGEATQATWTLPQGWRAGEFVWPRPQAVRVGPLLDYAYEDEVLLPVPIEVPASATPGTKMTLKAAASFLVCKETCIPAEADLSLDLPVSAGVPRMDPDWGQAISDTLAKAPRPVGLVARFQRDDRVLRLSIEAPPLLSETRTAYFFPYSGSVISHPASQKIVQGAKGLILELVPGSAWTRKETPETIDGVIALDDRAYEISAVLGPVAAEPGGRLLSDKLEQGPAQGDISMLRAILFALLGGVILNLMPCVFPILSLKATSLIQEASHPAKIRIQGLAFTLGVIATFLGLATLLIILRSGGNALGWGFHLQSPLIVGLLALLMLMIGLNMSGVYDIGTSLQGIGSASPGSGPAGAFMTGVLAVTVAAPCTAPFMGAALGFALTQPPVIALAVFLALAIGFSGPLLAITLFPGFVGLMPRPGPWMDLLRQALAFPVYATAAWLVWVHSQQGSSVGLGLLLAAGIGMALAAWLWGLSQVRGTLGKPARVPAVLAILVTVLSLGTLAFTSNVPTASAKPVQAEGVGLVAEPWSPEKLAELQAEGHPVLVDFTAAWCVTCQVNEKTTLADPEVARTFSRLGVVYLKADWTRRDPLIAAELERHGRVGVPLYLVYSPSSPKPVVLPQLLTEGMVIRAVEAAAS